ncbi:MAG: choice-of-anchor J domain-containing protein [Alistipes sp.]|nr:choice-of-anchor J domain-containing protein [Alistipes sp.]
MKKIFTLMLTLAVALFAGVSCTTDQGTQSGKTVKVTVSGAPEANLPATAGEFTLNYAITNATLTGVLEVTTDAAWVHVGEIGADAVPFTYDANTDAPGTAPREAVISFAYTDADVVTVTVRQDSAEPSFAVTFDEATTTHQVSYYTCDAVDDTMSYVLATDSDIKGMNITGETPTELLTNYVKQLATYGMLTDEYLPYGYWFKGDITEPREAMRYTADPVTLYAVGFSATPTGEVDEWDAPIYNVTLTTAVHAWEVPFKGYPSIVVENLEHTVTCEAGTLELSATLENPLANTEEATYSTKVETEATWVVPTWADGKLTLAYEANTTALPRSAEIELNYGQDMGYYFMGAAETVRLQLTQEADANATKVTFDIQVVETHFDRIVVNVTPLDLEADYVLNTKSVMKDENNQVVEENWTNVVVGNMKYPSNLSFFKGKLENHVIKMNPTYYEWNGYDYYVYAFATDAAHTAPLCEPSYVTTTVDASDYPTLTWDVEKSGLVWNENADRYDIEVTEGSTLVLYYNVEHPVEGAAVKLNGTSLYDSYNVVDGEPVIDNAAGTITLKIDKFDTAKKYHYVSVTLKYTNAEEDMWGVTTPNLRITQLEDPGKALPYQESFENGIGDFTINDVLLGSGLSYVWKHENGTYGYYMKASAYAGSAKDSESWLVSPKIDLSAATMPGLQFSHTHKFAGTPAEELTLWVKEYGAAEWTQVTIPTYGTNTNYTFVTAAVDLSAWAGKKVQIGFKYTSTTSAAGTWEVKDVVVYDAGGAAM